MQDRPVQDRPQPSEISDKRGAEPKNGPAVRVFGRRIAIPRSRLVRMVLGIVLILLGLVGFLPIVGFWMIPAGLLVLSYDIAAVRRLRRRLTVWWNKRR